MSSSRPRTPNKPTRSSNIPKRPLHRLIFFSLIASAVLSSNACHAGVERQPATVEKAISGDTILLRGGKTLKYSGIDAYPLQSKVPLIREYGESAKQFNEALVAGKKISVEWDAKIRDEQNRLLGYVYLEDGRFVNKEILLAGQAKTRIRAPNLAYAAELRKAEASAKKQRLGIWREEPKNPYGDTVFIGEKNTKIYYLPNSPELERIPEAQWIYFRSRIEAKAAGYRACSTCKESSADEME